MLEALKSGQVAAAALDVLEKEPCTDSPLLALDNVVCVPHLGASTTEAQENVAVVVAEQVAEALKGGRIRNAANMPSLDPKTLEKIGTSIILIERIGSFHAQLAAGAFIKKINVEYHGEIAEYDTKPLTLSLVKGILERVMTDSVNYVNALLLAKERGYEITTSTTEKAEDYASLIRVTVETDKGKHSISGTVTGKKDLRIVSLDGNATDFAPVGNMIWMEHEDRPGMVGQLGTILANNNVNIAGLYVGRQAPGGRAVAMVNVDNEVSDKVLNELKGIPHIKNLKFIKFS